MPRLALALLAATALAAATTQAATTPVDLSSRSAAAAEPPANLALDRIDQRGLPLDGQFTYPDSAGEGVTIYVVDTGVRFSHNDFAGRAVSGPDFVDGDDDASDCNGDGTALASIAAGASYGVAKKATVVSVRALDCDGSGTTADLVQAIDWVAQDAAGKPAVALLGWGGSASDAVDQAVTNAVASGVTVAVPAGGSGTDACQFSPARVRRRRPGRERRPQRR
jgi:subtilisin family serine protease